MDCDNGTLCNPAEPLALARVGGPRMMVWNVAEKDMFVVPEHWMSYPEVSPLHHYLYAVLYIFQTILAYLGNGVVIWLFCCAKSLRTPSNFFVVNLAICDLLMYIKVPMFIYNSFHLGLAFGAKGCQIYGIIGTLSGIGASATNVLIAYDRYRTIACPFDAKLSRSKAFALVLMTWGWVLPWAILPYVEVWGRYVAEGYLTACSFDYLTDSFEIRTFVGCIFVCSYCLPLFMVIYFYIQIVGTVFSHEKLLREQAKKMNVESLRSNQNMHTQATEIRIAKAAVLMCFLFVLAWTPYGVVALTGAFGNKALLTPFVTMIPAMACKTVAVIDPYVYAISHPRYRMELSKRLPWLACIRELPPPPETTSVVTEAQSTTRA